MRKEWSKKEINFIKKNVNKMTFQEMADKLGRSFPSVYSKANSLRITKYCSWNEEDEKKLTQYYLVDKYSVEDIATKMGLTKSNVTCKIDMLGLSRENRRAWPDEHIQFLKDNLNSMTRLEIANAIGRSKQAIDIKIRKLGLNKKVNYWSEEDIEKLKNEYPSKETSILAKELGRSVDCIFAKATQLKLKKENFFWTKKMESLMKKHYTDIDFPIEKLSKLLNKTSQEIYHKAYIMGLHRIGPALAWTTKQVQFVMDNYPKMSTVRMAAEMDKGVDNIKRIAQKYGVLKAQKTKTEKGRKNEKWYWTKEEDDFVIRNYKTMHVNKMRHILGRTAYGIEDRMKRLNIHEDRLKVYKQERYSFYYNDISEITVKAEYCKFWRNILTDKSKRYGGFTYGRTINFKETARTA